jgi:hypothetical protein
MTFLVPMLFVFFTPCVQADDFSMLEEGKHHFQTKHYYFATTWLERLLNNYHASPHRREALIIISRAYFLSGRDEKAAQYLSILRSEFPDAVASMEPEYRKLAESVPSPKPAPPVPAVSPAPHSSSSGNKSGVAPRTVTSAETTPTGSSLASASPLPIPEKVAADRIEPGPAAIPEVPLFSKPVATAPVSKPPLTAVTPSLLRTLSGAPSKGKVPDQKHVSYTLSASETGNRAKLYSLLKKLIDAGFQPVVQVENKSMDVYRLVTDCFNAKATAQKRVIQLARQDRKAFIMHDSMQYCVVTASFFSYDAALSGQNRLAKKSLRTEIVKAQAPLSAWQVTVGHFSESHSAEAEVKRLAERGIEVIMVPRDK